VAPMRWPSISHLPLNSAVSGTRWCVSV